MKFCVDCITIILMFALQPNILYFYSHNRRKVNQSLPGRYREGSFYFWVTKEYNSSAAGNKGFDKSERF